MIRCNQILTCSHIGYGFLANYREVLGVFSLVFKGGKESLMDIKVSLLPGVSAVKVLMLVWYTLGNTSKIANLLFKYNSNSYIIIEFKTLERRCI